MNALSISGIQKLFHVIPAGASDHPLGGLGYANFADELRRQVIGIDTANKMAMTYKAVSCIAEETVSLIASHGGSVVPLHEEMIEINPDYSAPGYGLPSDVTLEAIRFATQNEAMMTDPVYEGKSMAGLLDLCRKGEFAKDSNILYVHLGGMPALHAY